MSDFDAVFAEAIGSKKGDKKASDASPFDEVFAQSLQGIKADQIELPKAPERPVNSNYASGRAEGNPITRGLLNVLNGPLMGFGDEVAGAVSAAVKTPFNNKSFSENYQGTRDYVRGVQDQYKEDFPVMSTATQLATSAPLLMANLPGRALAATAPKAAAWMNPATQTVGVGRLAATGALSGAGYGAVSGAGESTADTAGGVALDALKSGATSAALGAATRVVGRAIGATAGNVAQRISDTSAEKFARQKVAEAMLRDSVDDVGNPIQRALTRLPKLGEEARIVDAGGKSTRNLLDTLATQPGRTTNAVEKAILERQSGRAGRLASAADNALGTRGAEYGATLEALDSARKLAAAPLYDQIRNTMVRVDDDIASLLNRTEGVHGEAQKLLRLQSGQVVDLTKVKPGDEVPLSLLDTLKQTLYDAADTAKRQGSNKMGAAFDDVRNSLTRKLDAVLPKDEAGRSIYKLARDAYAGPSQLIDAAELGRTAMKADSFEVKSAIKNLADSELQAFRIGALQALKEKTGTQSGQTSLMKMWMEPATSGRLKDIFGNDYRQFASAVAAEARLKTLEQVGRGSQTAARLAGAADLDISPLTNAAQAVASGSAIPMLTQAANLWARVQTPEPVRDRMGALLLSRDPNELRGLLGVVPEINKARLSRASALGATGGLGIGGLLSGD